MAARFWNKQNASAFWNATAPTNWGSASGVADGASVPGPGDDVTFDGAGAGGNAASTISATITVLSFTVTSGYTSTLTHSAVLTIAGNVTFSTSYTIAGVSSIIISAASTIDSNTKTWPNSVTFSGTNTKTLAENWSITGALVVSGASTVINGNILNIAGGLTMSNTCSGTTTINMTGGTWSGGSPIQNNFTIAGNVTISGSIAYNTGTLTYSSGTVTTTGSTVVVATSTTWNTAGISFNNFTFSASGTQTINSLLTITGVLQIANSTVLTFAGTAGFICGTLNDINTSLRTQTFKNGVTYTITGSFLAFSSPNTGPSVYTSDDGTIKAIITLRDTTTICCTNASFTRIDAGGGRPIITFLGTLTTTINIARQNNVFFRPVESFNRSGRRVELLNKNKAVIYQ